MNFNLDQAWAETMAMLKTNKDVLSIVAGVFFFLPMLILTLFVPTAGLEAAGDNEERMRTALIALFTESWPIFVFVVAMILVGSLVLYALLGRGHRPTVAEALKTGFIAILPFIAAMIILTIVQWIIGIIIGGLASLIPIPALAVTLGIIALAIVYFISLRVVLTGPIMAIEQSYNPVTALIRSWNMMKGNTRKVFVFLLLIIISAFVVMLVVSYLITLIGALIGDGQTALWIEGVLSGTLASAVITLILAVYVAIYRQLAGPTKTTLSETFD